MPVRLENLLGDTPDREHPFIDTALETISVEQWVDKGISRHNMRGGDLHRNADTIIAKSGDDGFYTPAPHSRHRFKVRTSKYE